MWNMKTSKISCKISHKTSTKWVHVLSGQWRQWTSSSALTLYSSKLDIGVSAAPVQGREPCDIPRILFSRCFLPEGARKRGNWKRIFSLCKSSKSQHHSNSYKFAGTSYKPCFSVTCSIYKPLDQIFCPCIFLWKLSVNCLTRQTCN